MKIRVFKRISIAAMILTIAAIGLSQEAHLVVETGHTEAVRTVAYSPDGKIIASGSTDGTIKLWFTATGTEIITLTGHHRSVHCLAFEKEGKILASAGFLEGIKLWDVQTGKELVTIPNRSPSKLAFSPDGKTLAAGSSGAVKFWSVPDGKEINEIFVSTFSFVTAVAISSTGNTLAAGSDDGTIMLWDLETDKVLRSVPGHSRSIRSVAFSRDGSRLASGGSDDLVLIADVKTGKGIVSFRHTDPATKNMFMEASADCVMFSPDGTRIASAGGASSAVQIWDAGTGHKLYTLKGKIGLSSIAFSPDGTSVTGSDADHTVKIWDVASATLAMSLAGHAAAAFSVAISPDGKYLATGSFDAAKLWRLDSGQVLRTIRGHAFGVSTLAFSADSSILASQSSNEILLTSTDTGLPLGSLTAHTAAVTSMAFSPDGKLLVSTAMDKSVIVWDLAILAPLNVIRDLTTIFTKAALSPDGKKLATGGEDGLIALRESRTGRVLYTLNNADAVTAANPAPSFIDLLAFSADGKTLASAGANGIEKLWDVETGSLIKSFAAGDPLGEREIAAIVPDFYPRLRNQPVTADSRMQATLGNNNSVSLLDAVSGRALVNILALDAEDWVVTTPDGRFDTNKPLDHIDGLHWIVNDEVLQPLPLDVFMRQYYEPGLLHRIVKCNREGHCETEFKPLPPIAEINRVQPRVASSSGPTHLR